VTPGDYTKGIGLEIVVIDRKGQKLTFVVKENAAISAKDGKMLTLNEIKKDDKVTVEYITNLRGTHKANSIKLAD
jgi:hypothetical protein